MPSTVQCENAKQTGTPLVGGELPKLHGPEDISRHLEAEKDNFPNFRMKRRPLLHAMQTIIAPFKTWGGLIAATSFPPASTSRFVGYRVAVSGGCWGYLVTRTPLSYRGSRYEVAYGGIDVTSTFPYPWTVKLTEAIVNASPDWSFRFLPSGAIWNGTGGQEISVKHYYNFDVDYVKDALTDWQVYVAIMVFYGIVCPLYGISFFLPTIIKDLGYTSSTAQLLTIPIYITAAVLSVIAAAVSDRLGERSPLLLLHMACVVAGFVVVLSATGRGVPGVVYFGIFLTVVGVYPALPANVTWLSNNLERSYKRAAGMAIHIGMGNFAGAMAANFYRAQDSPKFILGHSLELGFAVGGLIGVFVLRITYARINKKRDEQMAAHPVELTPAQNNELVVRTGVDGGE
ncbi:major facilitator superfamily domain-containing protein [Aspergillus insuetus]